VHPDLCDNGVAKRLVDEMVGLFDRWAIRQAAGPADVAFDEGSGVKRSTLSIAPRTAA
jgi:hypothetical protein